MSWHRARASAIATLLTGAAVAGALSPAPAAAQQLEACSLGDVQVCFALLARPRLDAGRRAAIEFHLAELEKLVVACRGGDQSACATLLEKHPRLPPDMRPKPTAPAP